MTMSAGRSSDAPGEKLKVADEEENTPTSTAMKRMEDVPPEVLTIILELVTHDANLQDMLAYRLVSFQWSEIMDTMIEKRIVSGQFEVFQGGMKIMGAGRRRQYDLLHVQASPKVFQTGANPFPFNSLLLTGNRNAVDFYFDPNRPSTPMTLPVFATTFGGNLTSFALHDQVIPINTLASMLGSMPRLKLLSLTDVKQVNSIIKPDALLPAPPRLPSFATLEVKSSPSPIRYGNNLPIQNEKRNVLYVWLIASYADQLERLNLKTHDQLPPLRKQHQYTLSLPKDKTFGIATTSDSAFSNLKELNIVHPSEDFLRISETPVLQRLSVAGLGHVVLRDLVNLVVKCGVTLEKLKLEISWLELVRFGVLMNIDVVPRLKTLAIPYPSDDYQESILRRRLLVMFPGLVELQLLNFRPDSLDNAIWTLAQDLHRNQAIQFGFGNEGADEVLSLNERLALLWYQHSIAVGLSRRAAVRTEMAKIFGRLVALGEKEEKIITEQLIRRGGRWNRGANLKIVSVSSGGTPVGDVCLIRRPVDA